MNVTALRRRERPRTADALTATDARAEQAPSELPEPTARRVPPGRVLEIDALRGLAAATVVLWHSFLIFPRVGPDTRGDGLTALNAVKYSPLHVFFAGNQAVITFFVISGFVLALPFLGHRKPRYPRFLMRRVARIWPAYAIACGIAFAAYAVIGGGHVDGLSSWFNAEWKHPLTGGVVVQHLALVDQFDTGAFIPVLWSLVHEMRISIVFPLVVLAVAFGRPVLVLLGLAAFTVVAAKVVPATGDAGDWAHTARYVSCFGVGILIAKYRHPLIERVRSARPSGRMLLALLALLLYTYHYWVPADGSALHKPAVKGAAETLGAAGWVLLAMGSVRAGRLLRTAPLQFLGRISYSLYLVHAIVILALVHLLHGHVATLLILPAVWAISICLATLGEKYVERPGIAIGRRLAGAQRSSS